MSQLTGGRLPSSYRLQGGGPTVTQGADARLATPGLATQPAVSGSANQIREVQNIIAAGASTIAVGGRYAEDIQRDAERRYAIQQDALDRQQNELNKRAEATRKLDESLGMAAGDARIEMTLDEISNGTLPTPPEWTNLTDKERVDFVQNYAVYKEIGASGNKTPGFEEGLRRQISGGRVFDAISRRGKAVVTEAATGLVQTYSNSAALLPSDTLPSDYKDNLTELRAAVPKELFSDSELKKAYYTNALQQAAADGDARKVGAIVTAIGTDPEFARQVDTANALLDKKQNERESAWFTRAILEENVPETAIKTRLSNALNKGTLSDEQYRTFLHAVDSREERRDAIEVNNTLDLMEDSVRAKMVDGAVARFMDPTLGPITDAKETFSLARRDGTVVYRNVSVSKSDLQDAAWQAVKAKSATDHPNDPQGAFQQSVTAAVNRNYVPPEWESGIASAFSTALVSGASGGEMKLPANLPQAVALADSLYALNPVYAKNVMGEYWEQYNALRDYGTVNGIGGDAGRAFSAMADAMKQPPPVGKPSDAMLASGVNDAGIEGDSEMQALFNQRVSMYQQRFRKSPEQAIATAVTDFKGRVMELNGHKTYIMRNETLPNGDPRDMNANFTLLAERVAKDAKKGNDWITGSSEPVTKDNVRLRQDERGIFSLVDSESGFLLYGKDGAPLVYTPTEFDKAINEAWMSKRGEQRSFLTQYRAQNAMFDQTPEDRARMRERFKQGISR